MNILITGGAGFIGSNLALTLLQKGHTIVAVDNFITSDSNNINNLKRNPNFHFIKADISKNEFVTKLSRKARFDRIYHLACPTGVPNLTTLAIEMLITCSLGTKNVLELARSHQTKILFTSSSEVYGNPEKSPQSENYTGNVDPTGVRSPYEEGKRFSESLVKSYFRKYNVPVLIARIFNTYGPNMSLSDTRVIPKFLTQALQEDNLTVAGEGTQKRTFCYVDDLVQGLMTVMEKGNKGEVYNIGSDKEITIKSLAKLIIRLTNTRSRVKFIERPSHDHNQRKPSLKKIHSLGWKSKTRLTEGIQKTIGWLRQENF